MAHTVKENTCVVPLGKPSELLSEQLSVPEGSPEGVPGSDPRL